MTIRIALVGFGHIARHEHLPEIQANSDFTLVAIVAPSAPVDIDCAYFENVTAMIAAMPGEVDAVAICTPPGARFLIAMELVAAGIAILLEKPPTSTLGEFDDLVRTADRGGAALFTAWHSQYAAAVAPARQALLKEDIASISLIWQEDVRKFHAGQEWIWEPGGFGVFDPGINGLSILTDILEETLIVRDATLHYPANKQAPIAAEIEFLGSSRSAVMDWRSGLEERWSIYIETKSGKTLEITGGGAALAINGILQNLLPHNEYRDIYRDFAKVVKSGRSRIDREPMRITADCFLVTQRKMVEDFI